jgi:hypothetical protein
LRVQGGLSGLNIAFGISICKGFKVGFWGYACTTVASFGLNWYMNLSFFLALLGGISLALLKVVRQIKQQNVSGWDTLKE